MHACDKEIAAERRKTTVSRRCRTPLPPPPPPRMARWFSPNDFSERFASSGRVAAAVAENTHTAQTICFCCCIRASLRRSWNVLIVCRYERSCGELSARPHCIHCVCENFSIFSAFALFAAFAIRVMAGPWMRIKEGSAQEQSPQPST